MCPCVLVSLHLYVCDSVHVCTQLCLQVKDCQEGWLQPLAHMSSEQAALGGLSIRLPAEMSWVKENGSMPG